MEGDETPGMRPGHNGGGKLRPPWTREEARQAGLKGGPAAKRYTLRGALSKRLKSRRADGSRPWDDALDAFVQRLLEGDPRAIQLALDAVDGPQVAKKVHEHTVARDLLIRPDGDQRGRVVDSPPVSPQALPEARPVSDNGHSVARSEPEKAGEKREPR